MSALAVGSEARAAAGPTQTFLEIKTWRLHNSDEGQAKRVSDYLERGLFPALVRAGAKPVAALALLIGPDGPYTVSMVQHASLASMQEALAKVEQDGEHTRAIEALSAKPGVPFVRLESTLLRSFAAFPEAVLPADSGKRAPRIFELRTYESQSPVALKKKISMVEGGESAIFERLGMRPVFFAEAIIGTRLPCIVYMLSFETLGDRERLWTAFGSDPGWKTLSAPANLKDAEIVGNIGNVMLRPLPFSPLR